MIINVPLISHIINLLTNSNKSLLRKIIFPLFLKKSKKCFSNWFRHSKCVYNLQGKSKLIITTSLQASSSGLNFNVNIKKIYLPKNSWNQITYHISRWRGSSGFNNCSSRQVAKRFVRAYENVDGVKFNQNDAQHTRQELLLLWNHLGSRSWTLIHEKRTDIIWVVCSTEQELFVYIYILPKCWLNDVRVI